MLGFICARKNLESVKFIKFEAPELDEFTVADATSPVVPAPGVFFAAVVVAVRLELSLLE